MKYKGTHLRLPLIGLAQARLLLALLRQASYWLCSGRPLIGFIKPDLCYWNISVLDRLFLWIFTVAVIGELGPRWSLDFFYGQ